jgi:transcriptional regulator with XRE-family HTH domain
VTSSARADFGPTLASPSGPAPISETNYDQRPFRFKIAAFYKKELNVEQQLGNRIRTFRERLELSQEDLAKSAGLDLKLLQAIEGGEVYPALGLLVKLARALGQRLGTFMDDQFLDDPLIVRREDRRQQTAHHKGETAGFYRYFALGAGKVDRHMEPFFIEIEASQKRVMSSHEGEEFIVVVSGQVELVYGKKTFLLQPGDSMYYNSIVPHCVGAVGEQTAEIYATIFMPF